MLPRLRCRMVPVGKLLLMWHLSNNWPFNYVSSWRSDGHALHKDSRRYQPGGCMHVFFCPKARYEDSGQPDQFVKRFVFRDASVGLQSNPNSIVDRSPLSCPFPCFLSLVYCFLQQEIGFLYLLFSRFNQTRDCLTSV